MNNDVEEQTVPDLGDLCGSFDLERYDSHDYCLRHDEVVPTDGTCPTTLRIVEQIKEVDRERIATLIEAETATVGGSDVARKAVAWFYIGRAASIARGEKII